MATAHRRLVVVVSMIAALLASRAVDAADQGVTGKKLLLKSSPKMVLLSKDALVIPGANGSAADPRCIGAGGSGLGGTITLDDGTNSATLTMPCANWTTNGSGTLYKFKDPAGAPKVAKIKAGLLKIVSPGLGGFPVPNGPATVDVQVQIGADSYCMTFTGSGTGNKFLVKDAATGACLLPSATPTDTPTPTATPTATPTGGAVTYASVQPIFQAKCAPCHTTLGAGGSNFATSYTDSQLASYYCFGQTKGYCALVRVQDGSMPQGAGCSGNPVLDMGNPACLTAAEQNTLGQWIAQGQQP